MGSWPGVRVALRGVTCWFEQRGLDGCLGALELGICVYLGINCWMFAGISVELLLRMRVSIDIHLTVVQYRFQRC
jgi:hypothetical protein